MVFSNIVRGDAFVQKVLLRPEIIAHASRSFVQKLRLPDPRTKSSTRRRFQLSSVSSFSMQWKGG
jgi:hypothetical protein